MILPSAPNVRLSTSKLFMSVEDSILSKSSLKIIRIQQINNY